MRIGLFLSRDDGKISETVDVDKIAEDYSHLPVCKVYDNFFKYADQQDMLKAVDAHGLDALVLAGNSPKYFEKIIGGSLVLEALQDHGININKIGFANIREQVAFPHKGMNGKATAKARLLIDVALAKVEMCHEIKVVSLSPRRSVLIIGTTLGGLISARELLAKGYRVYILEKGKEVRERENMEETLPILTSLQSDPKATFLYESTLADVSGWCGEYKTVVESTAGETREVMVGGIILAVADDTEWIKELKPKLQLDLDHSGHLRGKRKESIIGQTRDPGVWFIPYTNDADRFALEVKGSGIAVLSLTTALDRNEIRHPVLVSQVDENVCGGCGTCVKTCAFSASSIDAMKKISLIDPSRCKGCGNCVVACPTGARDLVNFPEKFVIKAVDILSTFPSQDSEPKVLALLCNGCGYPAADSAGEMAAKNDESAYPVNVLPLRVECGGNVDTQYVLSAFSKEFDGIIISVCRDGHCHHIVGNTDMDRRIGLFREVLRSRQINDDRLRVMHVSPHEGALFSEEIKSFCEELKAIKSNGGR